MKLSKRIWTSVILFGLFGQLAWTVENMYFNKFLYDTISGNTTYISAMVAASAIVATLTTLVMGTLSDRVGKRKIFMVTGYIIWGFTTMAFAFITVDNAAKLFPTLNAVSVAAVTVIIMDCVMTFFGSTANDGAFNAWVTDITDNSNRARVEAVLSALPLVAVLVVFGVLDSFTQKGNWKMFYLVVGGLVTLGGVIGAFLIKESETLKPNRDNYFKNIVYGFRPSTVKANKMLYISFAAFTIVCTAYQVFMPYLIIYIDKRLGIHDYAIPLGVIIILSAVFSIVMGSVLDKVGKHKFLIPMLIVLAVGCVGVYFSRTLLPLAVTGTVMMGANLVVSAAINATIRDYTPEDKAGLFQGIRMFFSVLLPMVIGPAIGDAVIQSSKETYVELGVVKNVPTPYIFLASAAVCIIALIPAIILVKNKNKEIKEAGEKNV
ncbi:MAG: MFS transporter [Ruminococcaceae bacterium]|jgi:MFS family permease|nr:MFS transporter [Oscillospiraceae bacterium]